MQRKPHAKKQAGEAVLQQEEWTRNWKGIVLPPSMELKFFFNKKLSYNKFPAFVQAKQHGSVINLKPLPYLKSGQNADNYTFTCVK